MKNTDRLVLAYWQIKDTIKATQETDRQANRQRQRHIDRHTTRKHYNHPIRQSDMEQFGQTDTQTPEQVTRQSIIKSPKQPGRHR